MTYKVPDLGIDPIEGLVNSVRRIVAVLPDDTVGLLQEPVLRLLLPPVGQIT